MNILALDQARNGAWSVFNYEKKELISYGTFSFNTQKYTYAQAVLHIEELVDMIIRAYKVKAVFIEDIQLRANVQAFKKLAHLQGVLVNYCEKHDYWYTYVAPSQWQNYCKHQVTDLESAHAEAVRMNDAGIQKSKILSFICLKEQFGIETQNDNLADAILIGWYAVNNVEINL